MSPRYYWRQHKVPKDMSDIRAQPKPSKADRAKRVIDTSVLAFSKEHPERDGKYRAWVRTHRCLLHVHEKKCRGEVQAAHLGKCGRGIKGSDATCIPLCELHHGLLDGYTLEWQLIAFLWQKALALRECWHRMEVR